MAEKRCKTCRWWDAHSGRPLSRLGDCRAPSDHRYWHVPVTDLKTGKNSVAMMDGFGAEETRHDFSCGAWSQGQTTGDLNIAAT